jgi:hypothetical protein
MMAPSLSEPFCTSARRQLSSAFDLVLSLHGQVFLVLLLEWLNSFRNFGLRFMQYSLMVDEYGLSDTEAANLLGAKALVHTVSGFVGSLLTDALGVRRMAIVALLFAVIARGLLVLGRSRATLYAASLVFSPLGDSLLSNGLYNVALKKLTTPSTRALAFAMSYASFNFSGGVATFLLDSLSSMADVTIFGQVYTGARIFLALSWLAIMLTLLLVVCCLRDVTVLDKLNPEVPELLREQSSAAPASVMRGRHGGDDTRETESAVGGASPASAVPASGLCARRRLALSRYAVVPTQLRTEGTGIWLRARVGEVGCAAACLEALSSLARDVCFVFRLRELWRVALMAVATLMLGSQWAANEVVLPPFLRRNFGEGVPVYTIVGINLWMCMFLPPLVGAFTSQRETFSVALPGMWLMAISPIFLVLSPTVGAAACWNVFLTLGEVLWSPRNSAWQASLAPTGREGLFLAIASVRTHLTPLLDVLLGHLNDKLNPNCPDCRDEFGHFCSLLNGTAVDANGSIAMTCATQHGPCPPPSGDWIDGTCPRTCKSCAGWNIPGQGRDLWLALLGLSLCGPLLVWLFLPFLRGEGELHDGCYGVCSVRRCLPDRVASPNMTSIEGTLGVGGLDAGGGGGRDVVDVIGGVKQGPSTCTCTRTTTTATPSNTL